jgi:molybdenum cofactor guanylyltransferase
MNDQTKVTGVILAGGMARRMNQQDKGLVKYKGRPMVSYAIEAMRAVTGSVLINANRNEVEYRAFGFPVIADQTQTFDGPLAGVLSALCSTDGDVLVVMPCDSPLIQPQHLQRLLTERAEADADIAVAYDGERLHPVFLALKTGLKDSLEQYLDSGERKIDRWLEQHVLVKVDFSEQPEVFQNINTLSDLEQLEAEVHE